MFSVQTKQNATNMRMPISTYPEYMCPLLLTWKESPDVLHKQISPNSTHLGN